MNEEKLENNEDEEENFDYGGVFTDDEGNETLRKSAQALGINPDLVAPKPAEGEEGPSYRYFADGNCKHCFGRGVMTVCISPSKRKIFRRTEGVPGRLTKRTIRSTKKLRKRKRQVPGPTRPRNVVITNVSLGNDLGKQWNTNKREPKAYKVDNTTQAFCKCIRAVEA